MLYLEDSESTYKKDAGKIHLSYAFVIDSYTLLPAPYSLSTIFFSQIFKKDGVYPIFLVLTFYLPHNSTVTASLHPDDRQKSIYDTSVRILPLLQPESHSRLLHRYEAFS